MSRAHYTVTHTVLDSSEAQADMIEVIVTLHRADGSTVEFLFSNPAADSPGRPQPGHLGVKAHEVRSAVEHCSEYVARLTSFSLDDELTPEDPQTILALEPMLHGF